MPRIVHIAIKVDDLDKATKFYEGRLRLSPNRHRICTPAPLAIYLRGKSPPSALRTLVPIAGLRSIDTHQVQSVRRSSVRQERCAHTTKNRTEVLCPRVTQAAMIAAASFGLRRSGTFATATSGAAYWAASVRHGPPWPLPVNAPKSIFQNSFL